MITADVIKRINELKKGFNIRLVSKNISDTDRRRITILVTDEYLMEGGDNIQAIFFEQELFERLKGLKLRCDSIHYEIRAIENKAKNFNPLRLTSEPHNHPCGRNNRIVTEILETLTKKEEKNEPTRFKTRRPHSRRKLGRVFQSKQIYHRKMAS